MQRPQYALAAWNKVVKTNVCSCKLFRVLSMLWREAGALGVIGDHHFTLCYSHKSLGCNSRFRPGFLLDNTSSSVIICFDFAIFATPRSSGTFTFVALSRATFNQFTPCISFLPILHHSSFCVDSSLVSCTSIYSWASTVPSSVKNAFFFLKKKKNNHNSSKSVFVLFTSIPMWNGEEMDYVALVAFGEGGSVVIFA